MSDERSVIPDNDDITFEIVAHSIDITDRNHAEEALMESEERFRTAFENAATGIALMTNDGYFLKSTRRCAGFLAIQRKNYWIRPG